eukprot:jgi/Hompol1/4679/HPOL_000801-RA
MSAISKALHSLKNLRNSPALAGWAEWHANNMGYRQIGLRFDDLVPEEHPHIEEALRRLPPMEFQDRNFRFKRAFALSLAKTVLAKEEWTTAQTVSHQLLDVPYLRPIIAQIEAEIATRENFENLSAIPAALLQRNRSS